jgi:hypothetical protein
MEIEYITTEDSGLLPKGTVFKPIGETNKEFKFLWGTSENFHSVTIPKKICEINFGKKLDRNNREDMEMLEESRTQGLENED